MRPEPIRPVSGGARPRALVVEPFFGDFGGATVVAIWMIEALRRDFDVTLASWRHVDLEAVSALAGARIPNDDIRRLRPGPAIRMIGGFIDRIDPDPYSIQRLALMNRWIKSFSGSYDLVASNCDEIDLGVRSIQYVHYPYMGRFLCKSVDGQRVEMSPEQRLRPWRLISGFDPARSADNLTLVNSHWSAAQYEAAYGRAPSVLYPPAPGDFDAVDQNQRDPAAAVVGRLTDDKRHALIIDIAERVRRERPDFKLRFYGVPGSIPGAAAHLEWLRETARRHDWIELHVDTPRDELVAAMARCQFGLHAKVDEHFGIAPAEMARAGCAVLVHDSGGQVEIVGRDPDLTFTDAADAAGKVLRLLNEPGHRARKIAGLAETREAFRPEAFMRGFRRHIDAFLAARDCNALTRP